MTSWLLWYRWLNTRKPYKNTKCLVCNWCSVTHLMYSQVAAWESICNKRVVVGFKPVFFLHGRLTCYFLSNHASNSFHLFPSLKVKLIKGQYYLKCLDIFLLGTVKIKIFILQTSSFNIGKHYYACKMFHNINSYIHHFIKHSIFHNTSISYKATSVGLDDKKATEKFRKLSFFYLCIFPFRFDIHCA